MKTDQTWTATDFSAGVASNPDRPVDGLLSRAEGVDISRPGAVSLSRAFAQVAGTSFDASVACVLSLSNLPDTVNPYVFAFLANGKIWRLRRDGTSPALVYADPDGAISSAAVFAGRLYWTTPTHLNNIALEGGFGVSQAAWTSGVNLSPAVQRTFANGGDSHPIIVQEDGGSKILYAADRHVISRLLCDPLTGAYSFSPSYCIFDSNLRVVDMFRVNSHTIVYVSDYSGTVGSYSERLIMDLSDVATLSAKRLDGVNILRAFASAESEYAIGGSYGDMRLYRGSGYDLEMVRRLDPTLYATSLRRPGNIRCDRASFALGGAFDGTIHTYGRAYPENPDSYAQSYLLPGLPAGIDACATAVAASGDTLIAGATIFSAPTATHALYLRSGSAYQFSGSIVTAPIGLDDPFSRKTATRLRIAHSLPAGTGMTVSVSADGGAWHTVRAISATDAPVSVIDPAEFSAAREFSSCRLRVELSTSSPSVTPVLRGVSLSYTSIAF